MFGWLPDSYDARDHDAVNLPGLMGGGHVPSYVDLGAHVDTVRDQLTTESCVAFSIASALRIRASIEGRAIAFPSVLHLYYAARALEPEGAILDRGCYPRLALQALTKFGVCSGDRWPFSPAHVNEPPPWDAHQWAADARSSAFYRIGGYDEERLATARRALSAGYPFIVGTLVDGALIDAGLAPLPRATGPIKGRHMMACVGYGDGYFVCLNSWGRSSGFGGFVRLSEDRVASTDCEDLYAFTLAPATVA